MSIDLVEIRCPRCGRHRLNMRRVHGSLVEASRCRRCRAYLLVLVGADGEIKLFTYLSGSDHQAGIERSAEDTWPRADD